MRYRPRSLGRQEAPSDAKMPLNDGNVYANGALGLFDVKVTGPGIKFSYEIVYMSRRLLASR